MVRNLVVLAFHLVVSVVVVLVVMVLRLVVVAASQALVMVVVVMVVMVVVVVVVMVVVLRIVGLVVHVGSGVVHMLAEPTVLVVVLAAHLLMMTPLLQTCLVVVVLWMLVASLIHGSQTSVVRNLERMMVVVWLLIWGQVSSSLVDQHLEGAGAAPPPMGRPAWWGSQPVVMVECHPEPGQAQHPFEEEFAW